MVVAANERKSGVNKTHDFCTTATPITTCVISSIALLLYNTSPVPLPMQLPCDGVGVREMSAPRIVQRAFEKEICFSQFTSIFRQRNHPAKGLGSVALCPTISRGLPLSTTESNPAFGKEVGWEVLQ